MQSIQANSTQPLVWSPINSNKEWRFELHEQDEIVGTLVWDNAGGMASATVQTGDSAWRFQRASLLASDFSAQQMDTEEEIATYHARVVQNSVLKMVEGAQEFYWSCVGPACTEYTWKDADHNTLVHFKMTGLIKVGATVTLSPFSTTPPVLPLLICFGFYLALSALQDSAARTIPIIV